MVIYLSAVSLVSALFRAWRRCHRRPLHGRPLVSTSLLEEVESCPEGEGGGVLPCLTVICLSFAPNPWCTPRPHVFNHGGRERTST